MKKFFTLAALLIGICVSGSSAGTNLYGSEVQHRR